MSEQKPKNNGLAVASLTLGILAVVLGFVGIGVILGVLAIIFGSVSLKSNKGKALAGIITGALGIVITVVMALFIFLILPNNLENEQANQRDTQRKNDISVLASDVLFYQSNNRGQLPDNSWVSGMTYKLDVVTSTISTGEPTADTATFKTSVDCDGNRATRNFAITVLLENDTTYCQGS